MLEVVGKILLVAKEWFLYSLNPVKFEYLKKWFGFKMFTKMWNSLLSCCFLFAKMEFGAVWAVSVWSAHGLPAAVGVAMEQVGLSVLRWCWGTSAGQWTKVLRCPPGHVLGCMGAWTEVGGNQVCPVSELKTWVALSVCVNEVTKPNRLQNPLTWHGVLI